MAVGGQAEGGYCRCVPVFSVGLGGGRHCSGFGFAGFQLHLEQAIARLQLLPLADHLLPLFLPPQFDVDKLTLGFVE